MSTIEALRTKFEALIPYMDEKLRRLWAASEAVGEHLTFAMSINT